MFETSARRTATSPRFSAILMNGSLLLRDWTLLPTSSYSKVSGVGRPHGIGFVAYLFFSTLESGFKKFRIRCRIRHIRVDESRIRKEKVADSKKIRIRVDGAYVYLCDGQGKNISFSLNDKMGSVSEQF